MKLTYEEERNSSPIVKSDILQVAEIIAKDKEIDKEEIFQAMEEALSPTAKAKYGNKKNVVVTLNRSTGEIEVHWVRNIVNEISDNENDILLNDAQKIDAQFKAGDHINEKLPPIEFKRSMAYTAKQIISKRIKIAERRNNLKYFSNRIGDILTGIVNRVEYSEIIVSIGKSEGIIRKSELLPNEVFNVGDRIKAFLYGLNEDVEFPLLQLSRTHPDFIKRLFYQEVPEIYDGVINIMAVARDPGSKAKIAVSSSDNTIDVVGTCIGPKGVRVKAVSEELKGEKIDIIKWTDNVAEFIVNSLAPATVSKILIDESEGAADVIVPNDQLSIAIGRRGQNIRLASKLNGWAINALGEEEYEKNQKQNMEKIIDEFIKSLNVDKNVAQILSDEYISISEIVNDGSENLANICNFNLDLANEIINRGQKYIESKRTELLDLCKEKKVSNDLLNYELISPDLLLLLVKADICTLKDLGNLSTDELLEISDGLLNKREASALIMKIRENWFK